MQSINSGGDMPLAGPRPSPPILPRAVMNNLQPLRVFEPLQRNLLLTEQLYSHAVQELNVACRLTKAAGPPSSSSISINASVCFHVFSNAAEGDLPNETTTSQHTLVAGCLVDLPRMAELSSSATVTRPAGSKRCPLTLSLGSGYAIRLNISFSAFM